MSQSINEALLEEKIVELWLEYPCLYDARSQDCKNLYMREKAMSEMAEKHEQNSKSERSSLIFL